MVLVGGLDFATGGNVRTPENVPGVLLFTKGSPEYQLLQSASRLDRVIGAKQADQHLVYLTDDAKPFTGNYTKNKGTQADFEILKETALRSQLEQELTQAAQANTMGAMIAARSALVHGAMKFGVINDPLAQKVADWFSDRVLDLSKTGQGGDTRLNHGFSESGNQQTTLGARNDTFRELVGFYERLFADPANEPYLRAIKASAPDIYDRMLLNRNALVGENGEIGASPLSYKIPVTDTKNTNVPLIKDATLLQGDLSNYGKAHNTTVTADGEAQFATGKAPERKIVASTSVKNASDVTRAQEVELASAKNASQIVKTVEKGKSISFVDQHELNIAYAAIVNAQQLLDQAKKAKATLGLQGQTIAIPTVLSRGDMVIGNDAKSGVNVALELTDQITIFWKDASDAQKQKVLSSDDELFVIPDEAKGKQIRIQTSKGEIVIDAYDLSSLVTDVNKEAPSLIDLDTVNNNIVQAQARVDDLTGGALTAESIENALVQNAKKRVDTSFEKRVGKITDAVRTSDQYSQAVGALVSYEKEVSAYLSDLGIYDLDAISKAHVTERTKGYRDQAEIAFEVLIQSYPFEGGKDSELSFAASNLTKLSQLDPNTLETQLPVVALYGLKTDGGVIRIETVEQYSQLVASNNAVIAAAASTMFTDVSKSSVAEVLAWQKKEIGSLASKDLSAGNWARRLSYVRNGLQAIGRIQMLSRRLFFLAN